MPSETDPSISMKTELYLALNNLRNVLFSDQPLLSGQLSKPLCTALIPTLHCIYSGLRVGDSFLLTVVWHC